MTCSTSCAARWTPNKNARLRDLGKLLAASQDHDDRHAHEVGTFTEYGLAFDYVVPGTFTDQKEAYWRYQISWGGPSDEFRFYAGGCGEQMPYRISYAFLDWFDGHERALVGRDLELMREIWIFFSETGSAEAEYRKATDPRER